MDFYFLDLTISMWYAEPLYLLFQPFSGLPIPSFLYYVFLVILCVVKLPYFDVLLSVSFSIFFPLYCSFFSFSVSLICCSFSPSWGMGWLISSLHRNGKVWEIKICRFLCKKGCMYNTHNSYLEPLLESTSQT